MPKSYFGKPTLYTFEDMKVYGPEMYDEYLTRIYGDWRQLPPKDYLAVPEIVACGGTWIVPKDALASNDWDAITQLAADAAALVKGR